MIRTALLLTANMTPLNVLMDGHIHGIKVDASFGDVTIKSDIGMVRGKHIIVSSEPDDLKAWLAPYDGVWVGLGHPMEQDFRLMHIRTDNRRGE